MSKLAIFSDVHGNLTAFEACLEDARKQEVTDYLCLGDQANFGPEPSESLDRLEDLGCPVVMGNTDQRMLEPRSAADFGENPSEDNFKKLDIEHWGSKLLTDKNKQFIRTFEPFIKLEFSGLSVLAYHGSPKGFNDVILPHKDDDLNGYFEGYSADLYVGGHVHLQFVRRYHHQRVLNPGTVGAAYVRQRDGSYLCLPVAEYALLEVLGNQPNLSLRRVPYSLEDLRERVRLSGMPHAETWLAAFREA